MKNVLEMSESEFNNSIQSGSLKICVIGIGRIGLPTALSFANSGLSTIGLDINSELVNMVNQGEFPLKDEPGYPTIFEKVLKEKKFSATTKIQDAVPQSNVIVLSLPTPMDKQNVPNYDALRSVGRQLHEFLSSGSIVIVESTIEPGFIENELKSIIEGNDLKLVAGKNFSIGVCPETANPGQILNDFERLPRLVGAIDQRTHNIIKKIYKHVFTVDLISMPDCKTANAVKLTTNVFRDLNIAFINELALIFEKSGIDIMTVLEAAKTKYNFQVHYPGAGVGGPCLPVNSYQMINFAKTFGFDNFSIVETGRKINESMPDHVIELLKDAFAESHIDIKNSTILILGVTYKPDVKDVQLTPAEPIISKLQQLGSKVKIYDPYFKNSNLFGINCESNLLETLKQSDAMIVVTAHKEFHDLEPVFLKSAMKSPVVIDSRCIINQFDAKNAGLIYRGVGRGKL
ncbi:nucleotide sugar dehydrogenase [Candidatus Nitrosarchaeum limnium]|jgi:nucleotide sugar dehydrogenase|uniref:UDP-N-acetyl-D-mannosamine dehydrogenase n=1 Tax=Candidatus Nitrosarchaeum limnium BG20 TaxID=859192 RepID=S2E2W9_9ARCH|nr:nucleotide sugar dehydrogenase [Candidatus Nitrosarchaeum limnium]EPA05158.1 nucleotide sugar dehydrogenase [Candidatus Nitrosarchaeum limnium BG20]